MPIDIPNDQAANSGSCLPLIYSAVFICRIYTSIYFIFIFDINGLVFTCRKSFTWHCSCKTPTNDKTAKKLTL